MKRLYLLRHAKSSWDDPALDDHERPLAGRGKRAAEQMAEHLRRGDIRPDVILCSSSRRTVETLARIAPSLGEHADFRIERDLYAAEGASLLARLRQLPESVASAMLIAHNPGIQDLGLVLAGSGDALPRLEEKFPTGALVTLELSGTWADLREHDAEVVAFVTPKELG